MKIPTCRNLYNNFYSKELEYLSQGIPVIIKRTNAICSIDRANVPVKRWKDVTYGRVLVDYTPEKSNLYQTCLTVCMCVWVSRWKLVKVGRLSKWFLDGPHFRDQFRSFCGPWLTVGHTIIHIYGAMSAPIRPYKPRDMRPSFLICTCTLLARCLHHS